MPTDQRSDVTDQPSEISKRRAPNFQLLSSIRLDMIFSVFAPRAVSLFGVSAFETRSLPARTRSYPRCFTFYVAHAVRSIQRLSFSQRKRSRSSASLNSQPSTLNRSSFTLLELLVVIALIAILMVLIAPAFTTIKGGTDIANTAYTIKDVLEQAKTHVLVNNTYAWVGFFEENGSLASTNPATAGNGRVVICTVTSKDGSTIYTDVASPAADIDTGGTKLVQVGRLVRFERGLYT